MGIGINIKVDGREVREAKRDVVDLRKTLDDVAQRPVNIKITPPPKTIDEADFPQQTVSAAEVTRQNQALHKSIRDVILEARKPTLRERYDIRQPPVNPPQDLRRRPDPGDDDGGGGGNLLRNSLRWGGRMAGYGAAIAGSLSFLGFMHNALSQAADYEPGEADLRMRGGTGNLRFRTAELGFTPIESLRMQSTIGSRTGFTGDQLDEAGEIAARHSRRMGIGGEVVSGYIAGSHAAIGANAAEYGTQLKNLRDTAVALGARGRIEEVLRGNQEIMTSMVRGRGGAELTAGERTGTLALQMALWGTPGQIGKGASGTNLMLSMDDGIRNGGNTPGQKIFLSQALGVEGVNSLTDIWQFNRRMNEGASPRNIKAVLDYSESITKQRGMSPEDARIFAMMNIRDVLGLNERQTEAVFQPGFREAVNATAEKGGVVAIKRITDTPEGQKNLRTADTEPMALEGNAHRRTVAQFANTELRAGKKVLPLVDRHKDSINRSIRDIEKGDYLAAIQDFVKDNPLGQLMLLGGGLSLASNLPFGQIAGGVAAGGITGAAIGGAARKTLTGMAGGKSLTKMIGGQLCRWVPRVGWVVAALPVWDESAGDVREDAVMARMNHGKSQEEAVREVYGTSQPQPGAVDLGALSTAIWALVESLRVWLHKVNNDPIPSPTLPPVLPNRFR